MYFDKIFKYNLGLYSEWFKYFFYFSARSISDDFSSGDTARYRDSEDYAQPHAQTRDRDKQNKEKDDRDEGRVWIKYGITLKVNIFFSWYVEVIKVYDGNNSYRRRIFRTIVVSRQASLKQLLTQALRAFHITKDPSFFHLTDVYSSDESPLQDPTPVLSLHRREGKRPAVYLRFK